MPRLVHSAGDWENPVRAGCRGGVRPWAWCERRAAGDARGTGHDHDARPGDAGDRLRPPGGELRRVYPNIKVDVTYDASLGDIERLEATELGAGGAPDLLATFPGLRDARIGLLAREGGRPGADGAQAVGEAFAAARDVAVQAQRGALRFRAGSVAASASSRTTPCSASSG